MKKIAITSEGPGLDDRMDPRFGRAAGFVIVDPDTMQYEYVDNGASQAAAQGAGVKIGQDLENMTIRQALDLYREGKIAWATGPNR